MIQGQARLSERFILVGNGQQREGGPVAVHAFNRVVFLVLERKRVGNAENAFGSCDVDLNAGTMLLRPFTHFNIEGEPFVRVVQIVAD